MEQSTVDAYKTGRDKLVASAILLGLAWKLRKDKPGMAEKAKALGIEKELDAFGKAYDEFEPAYFEACGS